MTTTVGRARTTSRSLGPVTRMLLATDLSAASAEATSLAFDLAAQLGASLLVVSVIDLAQLRRPGGRFRLRVDQVRGQQEEAARTLVARGQSMGLPVTFLVWEGEPGESIVDAAVSERADLIVVGSHGRGAVGRFLIGSVSDHVVRNAPCPVLVARAAPASRSTADGAAQPLV